MAEGYIGREAAINAILGEHPDAHYPEWYASILTKLPTADVAPVVHGRWCVSKIRSIETVFHCSECKRTVTIGNDFFGEAPKSVSAVYPYCHCGAKMD